MSNHRATPEEIEQDIERQRDELAATVTELHHRLDVKSRAGEKLDELRHRPAVLAAVGLGAVGLVALVVWRRRRHP
jgi:uncharacterized protein YllA (UPF0747 family)